MKPVGARAAAVSALVRQEQGGYSNLVLDAELRRQTLSDRDKGFAGAIFYTVLERQSTLDYILGQFLPKGIAKLDPPVRAILRSGLAQARYMQVPVSAAVNEAVKLTRAFGKTSAAGLVNAVLRRACGYDLEKAVFADEIEKLMVLGSAGRPVAEFLHRFYPEEALGILTHTADKGLTALRVNPLRADAETLIRLLGEQGKVTETIDNENSTGTVYVDGKIWTARSADGTRIPACSQVEIQRMEGVKLFVRELSSQESGAEREMEKEEA